MQGVSGKFALLLLPILLCVCATTTLSLDRSRSITQFHHTAWTARDGAPSQISALAQTADGYLWIGSARGLFRFDGVRFERYTPPPGVDLPAHNIYALKATPDGGLWIAFRPSGLGYLKDGKFTVLVKDQLPSSQIYCLGIDGKDRLWAGTHKGLALRSDDGSWTEIGSEWGFTPRRVRSILTDRKGRMWVAVDDAVVVLPPDVDRFDESSQARGIFTALAESPDEQIWTAELDKLIYPLPHALSAGTQKSFSIKPARVVGGMIFDRDGALWFTDDDGVKRVRYPERQKGDLLAVGNSEYEVLTASGGGLSGTYASPILEDREGNIWVGTAQGIDRFRYSYFLPHKLSAEYRNVTLIADPKSGIWAGSSIKLPLAHFDGDSVRTFPEAMYISSVYRDDAGVTWWGAQGRLLRQSENDMTTFPQPAHLKFDWLWEVLAGDTGPFLWINLGDDGLISFDNGTWGTRTRPAQLPDRGPSASFRESPQRTWLGYTESRVALLEGGTARMFSTDEGVDVGRIRVIRKGADHIWIGGELGLALFDGTRFRTIRTVEAERFGTVSGMVFSNDGALWLNAVKGIVRIPHEEVAALIDDPDHKANFRRFDFNDGLPGAPQMNWTVSTAVASVDGLLWFATDGGLVSIDSTNLVSNPLPPPISIASLDAAGRQYDTQQPIELPKGTEDLRIEYTALSLSIPERVRFRYMLEGTDETWQDASNRREAFYTNLGPGEYRFRVIASNNDGVWNEEGAVLNFRILPMFYQTNWFLALCFVVAVVMFFVVYRWRVRLVKERLHMQFEERLAERVRIAQDLHDTLLQGFVSASMQLDVAVDTLAEDEPSRPRFLHVHKMLGRLIDEGRDTVKGLRSVATEGTASFEQTFARIRDEIDLDRTVDLRMTFEGTPRPLHPIIHDEVSHVAHEAVINAFRHSDATRIEVLIEYAPRRFNLLVRDDGCGIDPEIVESGREGHWGLSGMRERAENIGARFKVWSSRGGGTEIELSVPGRIAYRDEDDRPLVRWFGKSRVRRTNGNGGSNDRGYEDPGDERR